MADPRASIDVVVAERGADHLLNEESLFVRAARGSDSADGISAVLGLDALEFAGGAADGLFPTHFAPRIGDLGADHRLQDAVFVRRIAPREPAFHARVAVICFAVLIGNHADYFIALQL